MIYLFAGHHDKDPGAVANGFREADLAKALRTEVSNRLKYGAVKHVVDKDNMTLQQVLDECKSDPSDVILDIHFNAGPETATGVEVIIPDNPSDHERAVASSLSSSLAVAMGIKNRGAKTESQTARKRLAVMREQGINLLVEVCFITNKTDMAKYQKNRAEVSMLIYKHLINAEQLIP